MYKQISQTRHISLVGNYIFFYSVGQLRPVRSKKYFSDNSALEAFDGYFSYDEQQWYKEVGELNLKRQQGCEK